MQNPCVTIYDYLFEIKLISLTTMLSLLVDTSITVVVEVYTSIASFEVIIIALIVVYTNAISIGRASQMGLIER